MPPCRCTILTRNRTRLLVIVEEQRADCKESHLPAETVGPVVPSSVLRLPPSIPKTDRVKRHNSGFSGSVHHSIRAKVQCRVRSMATSLPARKDALSCPHKGKMPLPCSRLITSARAFQTVLGAFDEIVR